ncbi:MAG: PEP-CTERM sorting domain-containing protein [Phycisphaerae bacterium]|nr:PEP-CTERM sorting domain-containing protein [Phycisphaerae bacterium]
MLRATGIRGCVLAIVLATVPPAWAGAVIIYPATGWGGYVLWMEGVQAGPGGGLAAISEQEFEYYHQEDWVLGDTEWSITLPTAGVISLIQVADDYYPAGDELALRVDEVVVPWTTSYDDAEGYFHAECSNLALSAGTHTITLDVTAICGPRILMGSGSAYFSAVNGQAVPAPAALMLGTLGAGIVGCLRRRRTL